MELPTLDIGTVIGDVIVIIAASSLSAVSVSHRTTRIRFTAATTHMDITHTGMDIRPGMDTIRTGMGMTHMDRTTMSTRAACTTMSQATAMIRVTMAAPGMAGMRFKTVPPLLKCNEPWPEKVITRAKLMG